VVRHDATSAERLRAVFERAARLGMTDVLLQVRGRGDAYYASELVPPAEDLAAGFDPLSAALEVAAAHGLRVHAWLNLLLVWSSPEPPRSPRHVVRRHPEWFVTLATRGGRRSSLEVERSELDALGVVGHFLAPGHPGVGEHLEAVVREIVTGYAIAGLHLDYVRYPDRQVSGEAGEVTALVERLSGAARDSARRAGRPGIVISAAVHPDPDEARRRKGQAWDGWLSAGMIDVAVPMCYGETLALEGAEMLAARRVDGRLWAGVALYNKPLDVALQGIEAARDVGFGGVALFSFDGLRTLAASDELRLVDVLAGRRRR
jgi:uncharacterized lipoprotein YddW (UPF0748 family)